MPSRALWIIRIHPFVTSPPLLPPPLSRVRSRVGRERKCVHVNLVKKTNVEGEEEYLFAPYSAFTVVSATWNLGTSLDPHVIELHAAVDNKEEPEDLPLAPWS